MASFCEECSPYSASHCKPISYNRGSHRDVFLRPLPVITMAPRRLTLGLALACLLGLLARAASQSDAKRKVGRRDQP